MRVIFAGSPEIALPSLEVLFKLYRSDFCTLLAVITNPDSAKGRTKEATPTVVGAAAAAFCANIAVQGGVPPLILKTHSFDAVFCAAVAALKPDMLISFAFGAIFPARFLAIFPLGAINIHPSLLPKYRGATPIPATILHGDTETGITVQRIAAEVDTGDILVQERFALTGRETTASLSALCGEKAAPLLEAALRGIAGGTISAIRQDGDAATYCRLLKKEDGRIDWSRSATEIDAQIRAYTPWPLSYTAHSDQTLFILEGSPFALEGGGAQPCAPQGEGFPPIGTVRGFDKKAGIMIQTGSGVYAVSRLQYRAKKALDWRAFLNGAKNFQGAVLG